MTILNQNLERNRIQITRISDNGINYVAPETLCEKMGMASKTSVSRILDLFGVTCAYIGRSRFYDELMANVVADAWKDEASKVAYMKLGISAEFQRRLDESKKTDEVSQ